MSDENKLEKEIKEVDGIITTFNERINGPGTDSKMLYTLGAYGINALYKLGKAIYNQNKDLNKKYDEILNYIKENKK